MLFVNALFAVFTISNTTASTNDLVFVMDHLDSAVEWTTAKSTQTLTKDQAIKKLQAITASPDASFSLKHQSKWKNNKSYKIIEVVTTAKTIRVFFHCKKVNGKTVVNRIKVTEM